MRKLALIGLLALFISPSFAQGLLPPKDKKPRERILSNKSEEGMTHLIIRLEKPAYRAQRAIGYKEARAKLKVEFTVYDIRNRGTDLGNTYIAYYDPKGDEWGIYLPHNTAFKVRMSHPSFKTITRNFITAEHPADLMEERLEVEEVPYTYHKGVKTYYLKTMLRFSETIVVHFNGGDPMEHMTYLQENFNAEKVQKLPHVNSFFLTLNIQSQESLAEILLRQALGDKALPEGYYFGPAITEAIEKLQKYPFTKYAEPSFVVWPNKEPYLSKNDYSQLSNMTADFKKRKFTEHLLLNPDDFEKSKDYKHKLLLELQK